MQSIISYWLSSSIYVIMYVGMNDKRTTERNLGYIYIFFSFFQKKKNRDCISGTVLFILVKHINRKKIQV